jgi:hypothetical protein
VTDRELLELAAKAAGYKILEHHQLARDALVDMATASLWIDGVSTGWNPLKDDGHALRLAVKMCINLHICESHAMTTAYADGGIQGAAVDFMDDAYAATRRAIVCAAAEIGKAMP